MNEKLAARIQLFEDNYRILFSNLNQNQNGPIRIGVKENRICRFCGCDEKKTTFRNVSHAIPESLGNKEIIASDECDKCNKFFSENVEVHFDKITKTHRVIGQIKGKKKIPSYKTKDKKTRIDVGQFIEIKERIGSVITSFDEESNTITIRFEIEPYIPAAVFKTLAKMAISVMPEDELSNFKNLKMWLLNMDHSKQLLKPLIAIETFIPGPRPNPKPIVILLKKKSLEGKYPNYIFVLAYGNFVYQIILPSELDAQNSSPVKFEIPIFPTPFEIEWKYGAVKVKQVNLTSTELLSGEIIPIQMHYDKKIGVDLNNTNLID